MLTCQSSYAVLKSVEDAMKMLDDFCKQLKSESPGSPNHYSIINGLETRLWMVRGSLLKDVLHSIKDLGLFSKEMFKNIFIFPPYDSDQLRFESVSGNYI